MSRALVVFPVPLAMLFDDLLAQGVELPLQSLAVPRFGDVPAAPP
jgi:hypothetical protein